MKRGSWLFIPLLLLVVNTSYASELPIFDVGQTCAAEGGGRSNFRTCMAAQRTARRNLQKGWRRYSDSQKVSCVGEASGVAGVASYIELLTCLQLDRGAAGLGQPWFER
jgi:hypothetical protein